MRQPPSLGLVPDAIQHIADLTINMASLKEMHIAVTKATYELGVWTWPYQVAGLRLLTLAIQERIVTLAGDGSDEHSVRPPARASSAPAKEPDNHTGSNGARPVVQGARPRSKGRVRSK